MSYWTEKAYWGDAATRNCVWLFQIKSISYPENGCVCGAEHDEDGVGHTTIGKVCRREIWRCVT